TTRLLGPGIAALLICLTPSAALSPPAFAETPGIGARQRSEKKTFTDSQIIDGFMKTAFGAEYHLAGRVDRIRKYHMPGRVFIDGSNRIEPRAAIGKVVSDIAKRIQHLDIAITTKRDDANAVITLVRDRD